MDIEKREEKIYVLRQQGLTYTQIASVFNISRSRAQQIYFCAKYKKEVFETLPPLKKCLSKRTQKALCKHFGNENIFVNPQIIADLGWHQTIMIKNIGRKSIREIAFALYSLGIIKYKDAWLDLYRSEMKNV